MMKNPWIPAPATAVLAAAALLTSFAIPALAADGEMTQFGYDRSRNMISDATGLATEWDVRSGKNIKWSQPAGSQSYAGPVIGGGVVLIGTNNEGLRNPDIKGDKGNIMAFDEETGEFLWQIIHDKLPESKLHDWPLQGVCSTPVIEGEIFYYVSNRAEVVAADLRGFRDGENDGPYKDEKLTGEYAGDILWKLDTMGELDVFPHNLAVSSPIIVGDLIFITTGNGVDEGHINVPAPQAPSFLAIHKKTGEVVWENADPGEDILHGTWSNASYGVVKGRPQVIMPGGDGWVYSFEPKTGELLWKFNTNPEGSEWKLGGAGTKNNLIGMGVIHDDKVYIAVGQDPEHGEGPGNLWAIDATKSGDITKTGAVWHRGGEDFNRTISTAAIQDGILYITDLSGFLYALDAKTGEHYWTYDAFAAVWGSPYAADGKIYLGDEDGDIVVLKQGKKLVELAEQNVGAAVYTTPLAKDGVIYILARNELFAIEEGATPAKKTDEAKKAR